MRVSRTVLIDILAQQKGAKPVTITAETDPKPRQGTKNNPSPFRGKTVVKRARVNGMIGWDYSNSVNNQRAREGNEEFFEVHPRTWGERIKGSPLVEYKGKHYLEVKVQNVLSTEYFVDGELIDEETIKPFLPVKKPSARQETEKAILIADYSLDNIVAIRLDKAEIEVE